jgi:hypothetical protein
MPQLPDNYDNLWVTILIVAIILALVITGYWRSRPKKKPAATMSYMRDAQGNEYVGQRGAAQTLERMVANPPPSGRMNGTKPLRSMHRRDDPDYPVGMDSLGVYPLTAANDGHNPVHSGAHHSGHSSSDHGSSSGYSSGSFDSGSSGFGGDSGGSSGGGDGGGGGGGGGGGD